MRKLLAAFLLFLAASSPAGAQSLGLSDLPNSTTLGPITTNSLLWACTNPTGCHGTDTTITAGAINFGQLVSFLQPTILTSVSAIPPLSYNSSTGAFSLQFDSTLSLVGSQLHVVSSGTGSGTVSAGTGPAIAQYNAGTGTTVGPATVSGDAIMLQGGALQLATVNSNVGTFGPGAQFTLDAKGRVTAATNVGSVTSVTGTAGQMTCTPTTGAVICGLNPVITQATNFTGGLQANGSAALIASNNLSDVASAATARTNLGLGTLSTQNSGALNVTGVVQLTGLPAPVNPSDAARLADVTAASAGFFVHTQARLATTAALPTNTYSNGTAGVGATITMTANGALTIDTKAVANGDRVLIKNEATGANNGLYQQTQLGDSTHQAILTRATDFDHSAANFISPGAYFFIYDGTAFPGGNLNAAWVLNTALPITVGTTPLTFGTATALASGVAAVGATPNGNFPQWNGGPSLLPGLPGATTATANAVVETGAGGTINNNFITGLPNANLANSSMTIAGHPIALGGTQNLVCGDLTGSGTACNANTGTTGHVLGFLDGANTYSGVQSFNSGDLSLNGGTSGNSILNAPVTGGGIVTLFAGTDTAVGLAVAQTLTNKTLNCANNTCTVRANLDLTGTLQAANFPALTGDVTTTAGSLATTIPAGSIAVGKLQTAAQSTTVNGQTCTLAGSCTIPTGGTLTLLAKTTSYTVGSADAGTYFTNTGAGVGVTVNFTLPLSPATNQTNCFFAAAAEPVQVTASGTATIFVANNQSAPGGNTITGSVGNANIQQGASLCLLFTNGNWFTTSVSGTWSTT